MSMRFNRFYNKLSKKNSEINLASYDDKLISSVPAEELDLPNGYTISDNKVFYNDTEIGKFSYRNVDEMGSIDLDSINIVDNEPVLDLDGINIPEEDNEPVLDLDGINIPEEDNEPVLDLDGINIPEEDNEPVLDLDAIEINEKAKTVPAAVFNDEIKPLGTDSDKVYTKDEIKPLGTDSDKVYTKDEIKPLGTDSDKVYTKKEKKELKEEYNRVFDMLEQEIKRYDHYKDYMDDDTKEDVQGYIDEYNVIRNFLAEDNKREFISQINRLWDIHYLIDKENHNAYVKLAEQEREKFTTEEQAELFDKIHDVQESLRKSFLEYESNKKDLPEDYVKQIEGYKTRFNDMQDEITFESKKETEAQLAELLLMKKQVDNSNNRVNMNKDVQKTQEPSKKTTSALDRIRSAKKEDKEQEEEKRIELIKEYADLFDQNQKLVLVCRELYDYLVESGEDKEYDSLKRSYFVLPYLPASTYSVEDIESKIKDAKYHNERLCKMIDNAKAKQEAEKSKKAENEEVKAKKASIAKALINDMKDIIVKEAKIKLANIKSRKTKTNNILDKINAKREATNVVNEIKDKIAVPANIIPDFLRLTKEDDLADKRRKDIEDSEKTLEKARLAREQAKLEKERKELEEKEQARLLAQAKKEREEAEKQEIINSIKNDSDVDFETLDERIYNKYSVKDIKELDEKYTEKIEKFNSKLDKTNNKIEKTDKKIVEKEVALALAIESSNTENELLYRSEILELKEKLEELKNKAEKLKAKISDKEATISSIKERFTAESIKVYEENEAEELRIMQEKEDAMNARLEEEAILERDKNRKEISKVFRQDVAKEESALNFKTNNEIKKLLAYTKQLEAEGKDSKEFIKNYAAAIEAERKANDKLKELELAMGIVKDNKKTAKRK